MKTDVTEMIFILDKSGSMSGLEEDTIGGFNSMLEEQKDVDGDAIISTVLFNNRHQVIHNRLDIKEVTPLTRREYRVGGSTALLDSIGRAINKIKLVYADTLREHRPDKVIFVITTDGHENSSREFSYSQIKKLIEQVQERYNWEFLFLGANIDAVSEARKFGIDKSRAVRYHSDKKGTKVNSETINKVMTSYRTTSIIQENWKKEVEADYNSRK